METSECFPFVPRLGDSGASPDPTVQQGGGGESESVSNANSGDDICISSRVGYSPLDATRSLTTINGTTYVRTTARALTRVMVLHPIAAVLSFLDFLSALAAGVMGNSLACLFSIVASVVAALAMVSDFVLFGMVRAVVNQEWRGRGSARFGVAMWCVLAGAICAFVGTLGVLGACCTGRSRRRRRRDAEKAGVMTAAGSGAPAEAVPAHEAVEPKRPEEAPANGADGAPKPKRRFWKRG